LYVSAFFHTVLDGDLIVHKFDYKTTHTTLSKYKDARQTNIVKLFSCGDLIRSRYSDSNNLLFDDIYGRTLPCIWLLMEHPAIS